MISILKDVSLLVLSLVSWEGMGFLNFIKCRRRFCSTIKPAPGWGPLRSSDQLRKEEKANVFAAPQLMNLGFCWMVVHIHIHIHKYSYIFTVFTVDVYKHKIVLSKRKQIKTIKVWTLFLVWVLLFLHGLWGHEYFVCRSLAAVSLNRFTQAFDDVWCLCSVIKEVWILQPDPHRRGTPFGCHLFWGSIFNFGAVAYWGLWFYSCVRVPKSCFGMSWYHDPLTMTRSLGSLLLWGCEVGSSIPIHDFIRMNPTGSFWKRGLTNHGTWLVRW